MSSHETNSTRCLVNTSVSPNLLHPSCSVLKESIGSYLVNCIQLKHKLLTGQLGAEASSQWKDTCVAPIEALSSTRKERVGGGGKRKEIFTFASRLQRHRWHFLRSFTFIFPLQKYARNPFNSFLCSLELDRCLVCLPPGHTASLLTFLTFLSNCPCHLDATLSHPAALTYTLPQSVISGALGFSTECGSFRISAKPCSPAIWCWCLLWSALAKANPLYRQAGHHNRNSILLMAFCIAWWLN